MNKYSFVHLMSPCKKAVRQCRMIIWGNYSTYTINQAHLLRVKIWNATFPRKKTGVLIFVNELEFTAWPVYGLLKQWLSISKIYNSQRWDYFLRVSASQNVNGHVLAGINRRWYCSLSIRHDANTGNRQWGSFIYTVSENMYLHIYGMCLPMMLGYKSICWASF